MKKLTADTITDEQIRELQDDLAAARRKAERGIDAINEQIIACEQALGGYFGDTRARCAEILNTRTRSTP